MRCKIKNFVKLYFKYFEYFILVNIVNRVKLDFYVVCMFIFIFVRFLRVSYDFFLFFIDYVLIKYIYLSWVGVKLSFIGKIRLEKFWFVFLIGFVLFFYILRFILVGRCLNW